MSGETHGHTAGGRFSPTYSSWADMRKRCTNPSARNFRFYGGRGITVCERWRSFAAFLADMGERAPGLSLERIDNSAGYHPGNCRWATHREQCRNRRSGKLTAESAQAIRDRHALGRDGYQTIGASFGVSGAMVRDVVLRRKWA